MGKSSHYLPKSQSAPDDARKRAVLLRSTHGPRRSHPELEPSRMTGPVDSSDQRRPVKIQKNAVVRQGVLRIPSLFHPSRVSTFPLFLSPSHLFPHDRAKPTVRGVGGLFRRQGLAVAIVDTFATNYFTKSPRGNARETAQTRASGHRFAQTRSRPEPLKVPNIGTRDS
jgi:hypothetical protein